MYSIFINVFKLHSHHEKITLHVLFGTSRKLNCKCTTLFHGTWPVDVTELFPRFCCWTLIWLSRHSAWLRRGCGRCRSLIDWLIDWLIVHRFKITSVSTIANPEIPAVIIAITSGQVCCHYKLKPWKEMVKIVSFISWLKKLITQNSSLFRGNKISRSFP